MIVTPQNRYKVDSGDVILVRQAFLSDPTHDWNEAALLHQLRHTQYQPPGTPSATMKPAAEVMEPRLDRHSSRLQDHLVPEENNNGVWWWDTSLPLSLAENNECEELYLRGLINHSIYYNSSFHRCYDSNHAGIVTLGDQVTMLFNLVCNSVLGTREGMCCS